MDECVFVVGSNSFFGSHFVRDALEAGYRVVGASRSPEPADCFLAYGGSRRKDFSFHQIDLNAGLDEFMELVRRERPANIVNFAAQGMVGESWKKPEDWFRTNTLTQVLLHDQLRRCDFLRKYVHVSTPEVYGSTNGRIRENAAFNPSTPYAVSRAAADMSLRTFFRAYGFPVVFTRAGNVYGPGQRLYRLVPRTAMAALGGERMLLNNAGASRRSFVHVRDAAAATRLVMERGRAGEAYHIATGRQSTVREVAEMAAAAAGASLEDIAVPAPPRLARDATYELDSDKIRSELSWSDVIPLEDGIVETVSWVRDNLDELRHMPLVYIHRS